MLFEKSPVSTKEQDSRTGGSVPNAFRNALFWHWVKAMPKALPAGFVTLLYALASGADAAGRMRFGSNGNAIRLSAITAATRGDEKEVRRYLNAAIAAGVVKVEGQRGRGKVTVYVLLVSPMPDWGAAVASLEASKKRRRDGSVPVWPGQKNGDPDPELSEPENGVPDPELFLDPTSEVRGTGPRWSSGSGTPLSSGSGTPNNPCTSMEVLHETAEVVPQPQPVAPAVHLKIIPGGGNTKPAEPAAPDSFVRCTTCHERMVPRPGRPNIHAHCDPAAAKKPSRRRVPKAGDG